MERHGKNHRAASIRRNGPSRQLAAAATAGLFLLAVCDAGAATYRYSSSSNRVYVEGGGGAGTLTELKALVPLAPIDLIDSTKKIWLLRANLVVDQGTELDLHGGVNGDVNELRIQSDPGTTGYMSITADYGTLDFRNVKVTSWKTSSSAPDTDPTDGRAFIRVRSTLGADGVTPHESRMDIINSEMQYLGFDASESYGLVWKVTGTDPQLTTKVDVHGDIIGSHLHDLFYGTYTYGHKDGQWLNNEIDHNANYGVYAHDDSDGMVIDGNNIHDNGSHGIYLVMKSDHATVSNNKTFSNTGHGIYIRQFAHFTTLENNESYSNGDAGLAVMQSDHLAGTGNFLHDNATYGVKLSQGASDNVLADGEIARNARQGIYVYTDSAFVPPSGQDGRPKRNAFNNNNIHDNTQDGIKAVQADATSFTGNTLANNGTLLLMLEQTTDTLLDGNVLPAGLTVKQIGDSATLNKATFRNAPVVPLQFDAFSDAVFEDAAGAIYDVPQKIFTIAMPAKATLDLTTAKLGTTVVTVNRRRLFVKPASASAVKVNVTTWAIGGDRRKTWKAKSVNGSVAVSVTVGDLAPGVVYNVLQDTTVLGSFTAGSDGRISFSYTPGSTTPHIYYVKPAA